MRAILVLLCALYAVSAQEAPQDPNLAQVLIVPNQNNVQEGQGVQGNQGSQEATFRANDEDAAAAAQNNLQNGNNFGVAGAQGSSNNQAAGQDMNARNIQLNRYVAPIRPVTNVVLTTYQRPQVAGGQVNYVQGQNANAQNQGQDAQVLSAVDASRAQIAAVIQQGANPNHFGIQTNAHYQIAQAPNAQNPVVWDALNALRGRNDLTIDEILNILTNAVGGRDYPIYNDIPSTRFSCENVHQAGFYADAEAQCQVIRRCDINGVLWSYLCPNMTLFNQITLVCDWFFNVNCNNAVAYYDYSNPRLYTQFALLDTPAPGPIIAPGPVVRPAGAYVLANQPQPYPNQG